jgi:hypothetical protein
MKILVSPKNRYEIESIKQKITHLKNKFEKTNAVAAKG